MVERAGDGARRASPGPGHAGLPGGLGAGRAEGRVRPKWLGPWWRASVVAPVAGRPVIVFPALLVLLDVYPSGVFPGPGADGRGVLRSGRMARSRRARDAQGSWRAATRPEDFWRVEYVPPWPVPGASTRRLLPVQDPVAVDLGRIYRCLAGRPPGHPARSPRRGRRHHGVAWLSADAAPAPSAPGGRTWSCWRPWPASFPSGASRRRSVH